MAMDLKVNLEFLRLMIFSDFPPPWGRSPVWWWVIEGVVCRTFETAEGKEKVVVEGKRGVR